VHKLRLVIFVWMLTILTGCSFGKKITPTQVDEEHPSIPTQKVDLGKPDAVQPGTPIPILYPGPTSLLAEPSAVPYPPIQDTPIPQNTNTPLIPTIVIPVAKPSEPLNKISVESILEWMRYAMENSVIAVFDALASNKIYYGPYASEPIGFYMKEQFIEEVGRRLSSHPKCVTYEYRTGEISVLYITTSGWIPEWDFGGQHISNCVIFDFADQGTKEEGLYLRGVYDRPCLEWQFRGTPFP
jgi:hypothetical protein